jgi:hypothetical protein
VKIVRLGKPEVACFPSYADYRPKTNTKTLWDNKRRPHMRRIKQGKETKNLNVVDVFTVQERT